MAETEIKDLQFYEKLFSQCKEGSLITMTLPDKRILKFDACEYEKAAEDLQKRGGKVNGYVCVCIRRSDLAPGSRGSLKDLVLMPGLYGDYDVLGPAHKQENLPKSKEEVIAHLKGLIMPPSLIVDSGYGLQPYWIFKTPLSLSGDNERAFGKAISEGWGRYLSGEAARLGWKIDNVSDPARMLRAPGTKNHKQGAGVPCCVIWDSELLYDASDFEPYIEKEKTQLISAATNDDNPGDEAYMERPDQNAIGDAERLLKHCGCIKTMVKEPDSISEPLWYALCTNVALAKDGPAKFHEWSASYSDYKHEETEYKIKRALEMKRPCTCEYIQKTLCFECPVYCQGLKAPIVHAQLSKEEQLEEVLTKDLSLSELFGRNTLTLCCWAKDDSPAQYAMMKQKAKKAGVGLRDFEKAVSKAKRESDDLPFDVYRDELLLDGLKTPDMKVPKDWMVSMDGIQKVIRSNGFQTLANVCGAPVIMSKRLENIDSGLEKVELTFYRAKRWKSIVMARSEAFSRNSLVSAADSGLPVTSDNAQDVIRYLSDFEIANQEVIPFIRSINRIGWFGKEFYPCKLNDEIIFEHEPGELTGMVLGISKSGDEDEWLNATVEMRKEPFSRMLLAASFASPLLDLLQHRVILVHIWNSSGSGKTAALKMALSIWGDPLRLMGNFNSTLVGMERRAGLLKHLPLGLDELQVLNEKRQSPGVIIYSLGNGYGKTRGNRSGGLQQVPSWRNSIISTGEQPLSSDSSLDGITSRVMELYGKPLPNPEQGRNLHQISENHYGHAGENYISFLVDEVVSVKGKIQKDFTEIRGKLKTEFEALKQGNPGVHLDNVAAMVLADYYASLSVFKEDDVTAMNGAMMMGLMALDNIKSMEKQDMVERAWDYITGWIATNQARFGSEAMPCYGVIEDDSAFVVVNEFNKALSDGGFNNTKSLKGFRERGYISPSRESGGPLRNHCQKKINGINVRAIRIKLDTENKLHHPLEFPEDIPKQYKMWESR